jgi:cell division protein FtsB
MKTSKLNMPRYKWFNKYSIAIFSFIVWIIFVDGKFSLIKQYKLTRQINELKEAKVDYIAKVADAKAEYTDLMSNQEKYAREKYFIGKEGEDVYILK